MGFEKGNRIGHRFTSEDANENREKGLATRRTNAEMVAIIDENLSEILDELNKEQPLADFREKATQGRNQIQRILALDLSNPKTARKAWNEIVDRTKGRPSQEVKLSNDGSNPFAIVVKTKEDAEYISEVLEGYDNA